MTAKEMAQRLNGCEYGNEMTSEEEKLAKESGLVIVTGYSDDNCEFRGAIYDEEGCYDGGTIYLSSYGAIVHPDDFPEGYQGNLFEIEAEWCNKERGAAWSYRTEIPHEEFNVYEDGELYCIGIVFALADLQPKPKRERKYVAVSIKHSAYGWKTGKPLTLWGYKRTLDDEPRCFADYTVYPGKAERYALGEFREHGYGGIIKDDEAVPLTMDICNKWKDYDTVLVDESEIAAYCVLFRLPTDPD